MNDLYRLTHFHNELNPKLWDGHELRLEVQVRLLKIAKAFFESLGLPKLHITDITMSGSNASFNYTDKSDIDLHLVAHFGNDFVHEYEELFDAKKKLYNMSHKLEIRGHDVEVYVQSVDTPIVSNGIYSVLHSKWIKEPKKISIHPDETSIESKFGELSRAIDDALAENNYEDAKRIKAKIKKMRVRGLASSGEYGPENLAFKLLRNEGFLDKLANVIRHHEDRQLSLEHVEEAVRDYRASYRGHAGQYDDEYFDKSIDKLDLDGKTVGFKGQLTPKNNFKGWADEVIPKEEGILYRGMSNAEYSNVLRTGKIESRGHYNIGELQKGLTYFSTDPAQAGSYATSFAPKAMKPTFNKPGYVVCIRKPDDSQIAPQVPGTGENEIGIKGAVDASDIVAVYRAKVVDHNQYLNSSRCHWERIK